MVWRVVVWVGGFLSLAMLKLVEELLKNGACFEWFVKLSR